MEVFLVCLNNVYAGDYRTTTSDIRYMRIEFKSFMNKWFLAVLCTACDFTKYLKNIYNFTRNAFKITCKNLLLKCLKLKFRQKSQDGIKLDGLSTQCHWASSFCNKTPFLALSRAKKCWWNQRGSINLPSDFYAPLILQITE